MSAKKIGIVTFVRPCNYGAALQCYALNKVISSLGGEPVTMDYWPEYFRVRYYIDHVPFSFNSKKFKEWRHRMAVKRVKDRRNRKFEQFMAENVVLSGKTAHNAEELRECMHETGIRKWITGSDQVWSDTCARFDPAYFLDMELPEGSSKYSYAASFGMAQIPEDKKDEYRRRLSGYRRYSVREQSGVDMVRELTDAEVNVHCDPTLLLSAEEWEKIATPPRKDRYILIYHVLKPDYLLEKAAELSRKTGLKVVLFTPYFAYPAIKGAPLRRYGYEPVMDSSPQDFVSLFRNAEYVLTNSFHGTVFSVLFHKNFWSQTQLVEGKLNTRSMNLLEKLGISGRELTLEEPLRDTPIDWQKAEEALAQMRMEAKEYLLQIIEDRIPSKQTRCAKLFYQYRYVFKRIEGDGGWNGACNLGDYIQTLAVENLYRNMPMAPDLSELVRLNRDDLSTYDGAEVILPMQGWFGKSFLLPYAPPAPAVKPVFVGYHLTSGNKTRDLLLENGHLDYYKQHEPIGCRDFSTRDWFLAQG